MERHGPLALLYSRLIPGMPFTSINYAAGMTVIREFVIATATGILPNAHLLVALGGSITHPTHPPPSSSSGVDSVCIPAQDFDAMIAFYGETLGLPFVRRFASPVRRAPLCVSVPPDQ
jgi:uncharacterized membrane protein YdjX (TVP38/TMEM64 family)